MARTPQDRPWDDIPLQPIEEPPQGPKMGVVGRQEALRHALRGVELGRYDDTAIISLAFDNDDRLTRILVSLIERVRIEARSEP